MNKEEILTEEGKIIHDLTSVFINKNKELERYKNIVDELEKWLEKQANETYYGTNETLPWCIYYREVLDKLKELKGSDE